MKSKGITDPSKIKYENEDGDIEEFNFFELPKEDQMNILTFKEPVKVEDEDDLSDDEIDLLNWMREKKLSKEDMATYYKNEAIKEYESELNVQYDVDSIADDELFFNHLKSISPGISDEDLLAEVELHKVNEEFYNKRVSSIREYYREAQTEMDEQREIERLEQEEIEIQEFKGSISTAASQIESVGEILLEDQDKNDVNSYILDRDANGASKFAKDLNDPKKLFLAAWFLLKGDEAFNVIHDHYKKQIENTRKKPDQQNKSKLPDNTQKKVNKVVVKQNVNQNGSRAEQHMTMSDLFDY